jgi:hypothetical protein
MDNLGSKFQSKVGDAEQIGLRKYAAAEFK